MSFLEIKDLSVRFNTDIGTVYAVNHVNLALEAGESLGIVGETGAGKTTTALSVMRLIQSPPGEYSSGEILFKGRDLLRLPESEMKAIRGGQIAMIFQDPMTALNPVMSVGSQIAEAIRNYEKCSPAAAHQKALEMLELVRIPSGRAGDFPISFPAA